VVTATDLLRQVQELTHRIHPSASNDSKRLKNTEILLRRAAFRLTGLLRASSFEDQSLVAQTLAQVNQAQSDAMMELFRK
jgi:cell division septum initiation protein DivIVA